MFSPKWQINEAFGAEYFFGTQAKNSQRSLLNSDFCGKWRIGDLFLRINQNPVVDEHD